MDRDSISRKIEWLMLFILMAIILFTPLARGTEEGASVWLTHSLVSVIIFLWLVEIVLKKKAHFIRTSLDYPILLFVILSIVSALFSVAPKKSFLVLLKYFDYIILYYLVVNKARNEKHINLLLSAIITAASIVTIWGFIKYLQHPGISMRLELASTYQNSNHFAAYLEMVIPIVAVITMYIGEIGKKIIFMYCACMIMVAFILTLSRGGWFSFLCAFILMGYLYSKKGNGLRNTISTLSMVLIVGFTVLCIALFGFIKVRYKVSSFFDVKHRNEIRSFNGRVPIWKGSLAIIRDYPVLGTGPGSFPHMFEKYLRENFRGLQDIYVHNEYLQSIVEWGIFSIMIIVWVQVLFFKQIFTIFVQAESKFSKFLALGIIGSMTALSVHCLFDYNMHFMANSILCVILVGIGVAMESKRCLYL
ncbi:MAG: O-antigen ligase family protein [bacterium]